MSWSAAQRRCDREGRDRRRRSERGLALLENAGAFFGPEDHAVTAHQVHGALEAISVNDDFEDVAVLQLADGSAGESLGRNMADARARGDAAETGVGDQRDVFPTLQIPKSGSELVGFLHARAGGTAADKYQNVSAANMPSLIAAMALGSLRKTRAGPVLR